MQKIIPHLWFDKEAEEASEFYASIFRNAEIKNKLKLRNTPSGSVDLVTLELFGQKFNLISAGPYFKLNPSVSFLVACSTFREVDMLWRELAKKGAVRMGLDKYPFSEKYGWVEDRYGLSWQIVPNIMNEMLRDKDDEKVARVTDAFLKMKKYDIEALKRSYEGK